MTRDAWVARGQGVLDELRGLLAPFGVALASDLAIVADPHPCPGYLHAERVIAFCPPVIETAIDRTRWMFFCRMMGCATLEDAAAFYEVALPLIVCHEASHHLRMSRGVASSSHFVEEQVCDRMAVAMLEASATYRGTLAPLRDACARMIERLGDSYHASPGAAFVPDAGALLVATEVLEPAELERLDALAERHALPLDELLILLDAPMPGVVEARDRARQYVDTRYTENPAEYWHLGLTWVHSYLSRSARPELADVLREHLLASDEETRLSEVEAALRAMLAVPAQRAAATEGLLALRGTAVVRELAAHARSHTDVLAVLATTLPRGDWDAAELGDLLDPTEAPLPERTRWLARLAAKCGRVVAWPAGPHSGEVAIEHAAANRGTDPADVAAMVVDVERAALLLDAWEAHGRRLDELSGAALEAISRHVLPRRARRAVLRLAVVLGPQAPAAELAVRLAIEELLDPLGAATDEVAANFVAHAVLERLGLARGGAWVARQIPPRGGPAWEQLQLLWMRIGAPPEPAPGMALELRLRLAAARAELTGGDAGVLALATELVERAERRLAQAMGLEGTVLPSPGAVAVAVEAMRAGARADAVDAVRALAPARSLATIANVAADARARGALDDAVCDVLAGAVPPVLRDRVARVLADRVAAPAPLAVEILPPLARAALEPPEDAMLTIEKLIHLRAVPLLAGVPLEQLHHLAELAVEQHHEANQTMFAEGDHGDRLYVILTGHVAIEKGTGDERVTIDRLGPSTCFGEMALFDDAPRSATARALTDCRVLTLSRAAITRLGRAEPQLYEGLLEVLSGRLRTATTELARRLSARPGR